MNAILSSKWDGLNEHLIASFWPVDRTGKRLSDITVRAPLTDDANLEATLSWNSPFENTSSEILPTLQNMLQSGAIQPALQRADSRFGSGGLAALASQIENKTTITKLNSTQVFTGMPPVKFTVTALFRAWSDPATEVETPVNQLMEWALPQELAEDGSILIRLYDAVTTGNVDINTFFPSKSPVMIAMKYKGNLYQPLVIESIGIPISSPIDKNGDFVELAVPMSISTLTAIDRRDWVKFSK
jgi:hypothetical protein